MSNLQKALAFTRVKSGVVQFTPYKEQEYAEMDPLAGARRFSNLALAADWQLDNADSKVSFVSVKKGDIARYMSSTR